MAVRLDVLSRFVLAKVLYAQGAAACARTKDKQAFSIGLLSLQDSVELALGALGDHLQARLTDQLRFNEYFDRIDEKIAPEALPYRRELNTLNGVRVGIKHRGMLPDVESCRHFPAVVLNFLTDVCDKHLSLDFALVSLRDAIKDENARRLLDGAEGAIGLGAYKEALELIASAWFRAFEHRYTLGLAIMLGQEPAEVDFPRVQPAQLRFDLIEKGIDQFLYFRFKNLVPKIGRRKDGELVTVWEHDYGHPKNWTEQNARFVYNFAVDALLKVETEPDADFTLVHYLAAYLDKVEPAGDEVALYVDGYPPNLADPPGSRGTIATGGRVLGKPGRTLRRGEYLLGWVTANDESPSRLVHVPPGQLFNVHVEDIRVTSIPRDDVIRDSEFGAFRLPTNYERDKPSGL